MKKLNEQERIDRFWSYVEIRENDECWPWTRSASPYGQFSWRGRPQRVNRIVYEITYGPVEEGKYILWMCGNKICCNPNHLVASETKLWPPKEEKEPKVKLSYEDRFWSRVDKTVDTGCWEWIGQNVEGHGTWYRKDSYKRTTAARIAWEIINEEQVGPECQVRKSCKNIRCVNPEHMLVVEKGNF